MTDFCTLCIYVSKCDVVILFGRSEILYDYIGGTILLLKHNGTMIQGLSFVLVEEYETPPRLFPIGGFGGTLIICRTNSTELF